MNYPLSFTHIYTKVLQYSKGSKSVGEHSLVSLPSSHLVPPLSSHVASDKLINSSLPQFSHL